MPFCKPEYYHEAIEYMQNYAKSIIFFFRIDLAVEESMSLIKERYGDKFLYLHNEDFDDYVYTKKSLESLSGKKCKREEITLMRLLKKIRIIFIKKLKMKMLIMFYSVSKMGFFSSNRRKCYF